MINLSHARKFLSRNRVIRVAFDYKVTFDDSSGIRGDYNFSQIKV